MREVPAEAGPTVDLLEQLGDPHPGQQAVEQLVQAEGLVRRVGPQRGDDEATLPDRRVRQEAGGGQPVGLGQRSLEAGRGGPEIAVRRRVEPASGEARGFDLGRRQELVVDAAVAPAALDPDVARA